MVNYNALADDVSADLIVVGDSSRSGISRLLRRSTASSVVRRAAASVAVVRPVQFLEGERLPRIEPPRPPGESSHLGRRHTYHYQSRASTSGRSPITWDM